MDAKINWYSELQLTWWWRNMKDRCTHWPSGPSPHHATREDRLVGNSPQYSCSLQARKRAQQWRATITLSGLLWDGQPCQWHRVYHSAVCQVQLYLCIIKHHAMNLLVKWRYGNGAFAKHWKATVGFVMSVCPPVWRNSAPTGLIVFNP